MKVIAINGSPRKNGNTTIAINTVFKELQVRGIETEMIELCRHKVMGCIACMGCAKNRDGKCVLDDDFNGIYAKLREADGIIIGSPVYVSGMTGQTKCFIDRAGLVTKVNGSLLARKVGAAVVAVRRAGACATFAAINYFFLIGEMIVPGSTYWNLGQGLQPGDIQRDEEGIQTFINLGKNMAWLLEKIHH